MNSMTIRAIGFAAFAPALLVPAVAAVFAGAGVGVKTGVGEGASVLAKVIISAEATGTAVGSGVLEAGAAAEHPPIRRTARQPNARGQAVENFIVPPG